MKRKGKHRGSHGLISVFLAIILVPCIVFTCIFGDLSRVQLSMATANSAGDLALYSLLARYDEDLKEYYGLVGSCQDINKFFDVTANYFQGMLDAAGVSGEGSAIFLEYLRQLQEQGYSDFLQCDLSNLVVAEAPHGAMGDNAALIEDGIVEFMKYRGPVEVTTKLLDRFAELDFTKTLNETKKNKTVTDAKQDYAEQQGTLLETAFYTYLAIREYEKAQQANNCPAPDTYSSLEQKLQNIRDDLKGATAIITQYYFPNSETIKTWTDKPFLKLSDYTAEPEDFAIVTSDEGGNDLYCLDNATLETLLEGIDEKIEAIQKAGDAFVTSYGEIGSPVTGVNYVVYCLKVQKIIESSDLINTMKTKGDELLKQYAKLKAASEECEPLPDGDDLPADWATQITEAMTKIEELQKAYYDESNTSSDYVKYLSEYMAKAAEVAPQVKNRSYTFTSKTGGNVTLGTFAQNISGEINTLRSTLQEQIDRLNVAIDGGKLPNGKTAQSLDKLVDLAKEFTTARENWGKAALNSNTTYGDSEYDLYQGAVETSQTGDTENEELEGEKIAAQITAESVAELKSRLVNIRTDMQNCLDAMTKITYGGKPLQELNSADALISAARTVVPETTDLSLSAASEAARTYFTSLMQPAEGQMYQAPTADNSAGGNNPDLSKATPKLYEFLKKQLKEKEGELDSEITKYKEQNQGYKDEANKAGNKAQEVGEYLDKLGSDLTEVRQKDGPNIGDVGALDGLITVVSNILNGSGDELRDQLYVCEYIMDMFSYSSFNNEGKYKLANDGIKDGEPKKVTFNDYPYSTVQEQWDTVDPADVTGNQSLTNTPINYDSNHAFLGEVEYILYGKTSIQANLASAYASIFAIRELVNVVSAFCNFYNNHAVNSIATMVAGATAGMVPIPLTKCIILVALSTLESAKDLDRLKAGAPVELYKVKSDNWYYNLDAEDAVFPPGKGEVKNESGLYYSDYMYLFLLMGLTGKEEVYSAMLLRVGDLIQANMRKLTGNSGFDLMNTKCYFSLQADVRVKPLMISLPIVSSVQGSENMRETTDWCTYHIDLIRGYS